MVNFHSFYDSQPGTGTFSIFVDCSRVICSLQQLTFVLISSNRNAMHLLKTLFNDRCLNKLNLYFKYIITGIVNRNQVSKSHAMKPSLTVDRESGLMVNMTKDKN